MFVITFFYFISFPIWRLSTIIDLLSWMLCICLFNPSSLPVFPYDSEDDCEPGFLELCSGRELFVRSMQKAKFALPEGQAIVDIPDYPETLDLKG